MTKAFWLWLSSAFTVFCNGCMDGLGAAGGGGALMVARTDSTDAAALSQNGLLGFGVGLFFSGIHAFVVWRSANPMPNPFFIPMVDRFPPLETRTPHKPPVVAPPGEPDKLPITESDLAPVKAQIAKTETTGQPITP